MATAVEDVGARAAARAAARHRTEAGADPGPGRTPRVDTRGAAGPARATGAAPAAPTPADAGPRPPEPPAMTGILELMNTARTKRLNDVETQRVRGFIEHERAAGRETGLLREEAITQYGDRFREHFNINDLAHSPLVEGLTGSQIAAAYDVMMEDRMELIDARSEEGFNEQMQQLQTGDADGFWAKKTKSVKRGVLGFRKEFVKTGHRQQAARQMKETELTPAYLTSVKDRVKQMDMTQVGDQRQYVSQEHDGVNRTATALQKFSREARTSMGKKDEQEKWKKAQASFDNALRDYGDSTFEKFQTQILNSPDLDRLRGTEAPLLFARRMAEALSVIECEDVRNRVLLDQALNRNIKAAKMVGSLEKGGRGQRWWKQIKGMATLSAGAGGFAFGMAARTGAIALRAGAFKAGVGSLGVSAVGGAVVGAGIGAFRGYHQKGEQFRQQMAKESEKTSGQVDRGAQAIRERLSADGKRKADEYFAASTAEANAARQAGGALTDERKQQMREAFLQGLSDGDRELYQTAGASLKRERQQAKDIRGFRTRTADWAKQRLQNLIQGFEHHTAGGAREVQYYRKTLPAFAASMERLLDEGAIALGTGADRRQNEKEINDLLMQLNAIIATQELDLPSAGSAKRMAWVGRSQENAAKKSVTDQMVEAAQKRREKEQWKAARGGIVKGGIAGATFGAIGNLAVRGVGIAADSVQDAAGATKDALGKWLGPDSDPDVPVVLGGGDPGSILARGGGGGGGDVAPPRPVLAPDTLSVDLQPDDSGAVDTGAPEPSTGTAPDTGAESPIEIAPLRPTTTSAEADATSSGVASAAEPRAGIDLPPAAAGAPEEMQLSLEHFKLAVVGKGEGVEHVLIRQLKEYADAYGYDEATDGSLGKWAGRKAHEIAIANKYVEEVDGEWVETRVRPVDEIAYVLDPDGSGLVREYSGHVGPGGELKFLGESNETGGYEYRTKLGTKEYVSSSSDVSDEVQQQLGQKGPLHIEGSEKAMADALTRAGEDLDDWALTHNPDTGETWATRLYSSVDHDTLRPLGYASTEPLQIPDLGTHGADAIDVAPTSAEADATAPPAIEPSPTESPEPSAEEAADAVEPLVAESDPVTKAAEDVSRARVDQIFDDARTLVAGADNRAELDALLNAREQSVLEFIDHNGPQDEDFLENMREKVMDELSDRMASTPEPADAIPGASGVAAAAAETKIPVAEKIGFPHGAHVEFGQKAEEFFRSHSAHYTDGKLTVGKDAVLLVDPADESLKFSMDSSGRLQVSVVDEVGGKEWYHINDHGQFEPFENPDAGAASSAASTAAESAPPEIAEHNYYDKSKFQSGTTYEAKDIQWAEEHEGQVWKQGDRVYMLAKGEPASGTEGALDHAFREVSDRLVKELPDIKPSDAHLEKQFLTTEAGKTVAYILASVKVETL